MYQNTHRIIVNPEKCCILKVSFNRAFPSRGLAFCGASLHWTNTGNGKLINVELEFRGKNFQNTSFCLFSTTICNSHAISNISKPFLSS